MEALQLSFQQHRRKRSFYTSGQSYKYTSLICRQREFYNMDHQDENDILIGTTFFISTSLSLQFEKVIGSILLKNCFTPFQKFDFKTSISSLHLYGKTFKIFL
jgi:hypothetical protein